MGYWKTRVVPRIMKIFEKDGSKKTAAGEACKAFDESKEQLTKAFEEKKAEIQSRILHIFEQSSPETRATVREPTEAAIKKNSPAIAKFIDDLAEIDFPGAKLAGQAVGKYGAGLVNGPIIFILEKVSVLLPEEIAPAEEEEQKIEEITEKTEQKEETTPSTDLVQDREEKEEEISAEGASTEAVVAEKSEEGASPDQKIEEVAEKSEEGASPDQKIEEVAEKSEEDKEDIPKQPEEEKTPSA